MEGLIPEFSFHRVLIEPWTDHLGLYGWIAAMGFAVGAACGLVGNYLILRRMALLGDAVSHSVLPGLVIAFLLSGTRGTGAMFAGALSAGMATSAIIEVIHRWSRVKQDAAIGITFSTLFAAGVVLISVFAQQVDLDADCVLYGEIAFVPLEPMVNLGSLVLGPESFVRMMIVLLVVAGLIVAFYKELLVTSFDAGLARSLGLRPHLVHHCLMAALSIVIVSAFEAVGAILVIAMLILPGATASLLTHQLKVMHGLAVVHAALSSVFGISLSVWLECSTAPAMVVAGAALFALAWLFSPTEGLVARWLRTRRTPLQPPTQAPVEA